MAPVSVSPLCFRKKVMSRCSPSGFVISTSQRPLNEFWANSIMATIAVAVTVRNIRSFIIAFSWKDLVAYVGEMFAVGRPRIHVHGSLPSEQAQDFAGLHGRQFVRRHGHHPDHDVLVGRVPFRALGKGNEYHPFAVGRRMRKPILHVVAGNALGLLVIGAGALRRNPPDVPGTAAI